MVISVAIELPTIFTLFSVTYFHICYTLDCGMCKVSPDRWVSQHELKAWWANSMPFIHSIDDVISVTHAQWVNHLYCSMICIIGGTLHTFSTSNQCQILREKDATETTILKIMIKFLQRYIYVCNSYTMAASGLWGKHKCLRFDKAGGRSLSGFRSHECVPHKPWAKPSISVLYHSNSPLTSYLQDT